MKIAVSIAFALAASLVMSPAAAQDNQTDDPVAEGLSLLEQGTRLLMQGIIDELGTAWDDLEATISELGPYDPPEILPNGDIIIKRKTPLQVAPPSETEL